ncbi:unnamed protein product [Ectocarpus sp. 4 AP-2014]
MCTALSMICTEEETQSTPTDKIQTVILAETIQFVPNGAKRLGVFPLSTLFHRWLHRLTGSADDHMFEYVEHLNDIALDCRESNLRTSTTWHGNDLDMNSLKRAFCVEGVSGATRKAGEINRSQESCWSVVGRLPPLPDVVFATSVSNGRETHHVNRRRCNMQGPLRTSSICRCVLSTGLVGTNMAAALGVLKLSQEYGIFRVVMKKM